LPNGTVRYISGKYATYLEAKANKNKIVVLGIKDAFIVKYQNGEKVGETGIRNY
jgi:hypothetical protein